MRCGAVQERLLSPAVFMFPANALLTRRGRLLLARCIVEQKWPLRRAAERLQVSATTPRAEPAATGSRARWAWRTAPADRTDFGLARLVRQHTMPEFPLEVLLDRG